MNYTKIFAHDGTVAGINRAIDRGARVAAAYVDDARKRPQNGLRAATVFIALTKQAMILMAKRDALKVRNN